MIRQIKNRLAGRQKILEAKLSWGEFQEVMNRRKEDYLIKINLDDMRKLLTKSEVLKKLACFEPSDRRYCDIAYQIYANTQESRHYIELKIGKNRAGICQYTGQVIQFKGSSLESASLEWEWNTRK
jgi:hypothetical protein